MERPRTHVITTALPSLTADRRLRTRRYVVSQTVRMACFLAAVALPLPVLARLALLAASIVLPWGAVVAANAGPARTRRRVAGPPVAALPEAPAPAAAGDTGRTSRGDATPPRPESRWYRLRWRISYALLQVYGPAQLSGDADPSRRMRAERADRRLGAPARPQATLPDAADVGADRTGPPLLG